MYSTRQYELEPSQLWNCSQNGKWVDVSLDYAGLFFRVIGGKAGNWSRVQPENAPHLNKVTIDRHGPTPSNIGPIYRTTRSLSPGGSTGWMSVGHNYNFELNFGISGGKVRPRNKAVKIWKCLKNPK